MYYRLYLKALHSNIDMTPCPSDHPPTTPPTHQAQASDHPVPGSPVRPPPHPDRRRPYLKYNYTASPGPPGAGAGHGKPGAAGQLLAALSGACARCCLSGHMLKPALVAWARVHVVIKAFATDRERVSKRSQRPHKLEGFHLPTIASGDAIAASPSPSRALIAPSRAIALSLRLM